MDVASTGHGHRSSARPGAPRQAARRLTLEPSDLGGGPVALLVAGGDTEDDGGLGGVVDVRVGEAGRLHQAGGAGPAVHAHEGQLRRRGRLGLGRLVALDGQVHRVLDDLARRHRRRLPGQVGAVRALRGGGEKTQQKTGA